MYPDTRLRRLRKTKPIRDLVADHRLDPSDLVQPFFIIEGQNKREAILTMPGIERISVDILLQKAKEAESLGIKAIALFPTIADDLKDEDGSEAFNTDNLVCRAVRAIKDVGIEVAVICDVALDPYTSHGHDGILNDEDIVDNDLTIDVLVAQSLALAQAGVDIVAPSDMMDGRIGAIRASFEESGYCDTAILSYSIKYTTNLYGPFRDAVKSKQGGREVSKATYQADWRRGAMEAIAEVEEDISEGADIVMVKPAIFYLDIIQKISQEFLVPVFAYQVSGEYAQIKFAAQNGAIENEAEAMLEALTAIKRAGATAIFSYASMEVAKYLKKDL